MSDTPRTDAIALRSMKNLAYMEMINDLAELARQLEREADDLREALEDRRKIHGAHVRLVRQAIFNVLDTGGRLPDWDFYAAYEDRANAQRVDFADQVVTWLAQNDKGSVAVYSATLERAKRLLEERMHAHMHAHGCYDSSTNAWEYQGGQRTWNMAWKEGMQEALDIIDALLKGER